MLRELAHALLRAETGAVAVARLCPRCGSSSHGRPSVRVASGSAPDVSISYTTDLVAVAWSDAGAVGIDVEQVGPPIDGLDRQGWTRAEAVFKAGAEVPTRVIPMPDGYVATVAGTDVSWRLAGPAAPAR